MQLKLVRVGFTPRSTEGLLYIDGKFEAFTLEDAVRDVKIPGETAIPYGTYDVALTWSPRFKCIMPQLLYVPNFKGVRIHCGNRPENTEGCILVGDNQTTLTDAWIGKSKSAYADLYKKLQDAKEEITLTVTK